MACENQLPYSLTGPCTIYEKREAQKYFIGFAMKRKQINRIDSLIKASAPRGLWMVGPFVSNSKMLTWILCVFAQYTMSTKELTPCNIIPSEG